MLLGPAEMRYFGHSGLKAIRPARPLRILILTSLRDVVGYERNGSTIQTNHGERYMVGLIEHTVRQTLPQGQLYGLVEVVGVATDDRQHEPNLPDTFPRVPTTGFPWIHSKDLKGPDGRLITTITTNIPSCFRSLSKGELLARREAKLRFEGRILDLMDRIGADLLVSYHYMAKLEFVFPPRMQFGLVLNIHPAIAVKNHPFCFRGPVPVNDAIERARQNGGEVYTGATLHVVDEDWDSGPVIAYADNTPVFAQDNIPTLIYRNHATELRVFTAGLKHYSQRIHPHLSGANLCNLAEV